MSGLTVELTVWNLSSFTKRETTAWKLCYFKRLWLMCRGAFQYSLERFTVKGDECHICDLWWRLLQLNTIDTLCRAFGCNALLEATAVWGSSNVMTDEKYQSDCNCSGLFLFEPVQEYQLLCCEIFYGDVPTSCPDMPLNYAVKTFLHIKQTAITGFNIWQYSVDYIIGS
jgi:hypothetical protein